MPVDVRNEFRTKTLTRRETRALAVAVMRAMMARYHLPRRTEVGVTFVDNEQMRLCNKKFMNKPVPTDVLAFPLFEERPPDDAPAPHLGDVIVSVDQAAIQAAERGHSTAEEARLLLIHGFLHLIGYDDMTPAAKRKMDEETRECLKDMNAKNVL